MTVYLCFHARK